MLRTKQYKLTHHSLNTYNYFFFFCQIDMWKSNSNIKKLGKALCLRLSGILWHHKLKFQILFLRCCHCWIWTQWSFFYFEQRWIEEMCQYKWLCCGRSKCKISSMAIKGSKYVVLKSILWVHYYFYTFVSSTQQKKTEYVLWKPQKMLESQKFWLKPNYFKK